MAPAATSPIIAPVFTEKSKLSQLTPQDLDLLKEYIESQKGTTETTKKLKVEPLQLKGVLDQYESFDITPTLGREYHEDVQLADLIQAENSDELLRDLAITISQRNVVVFRKQTSLTNDLQKQLVHRLGLLAGKPPTSGLHIHPILNSNREGGGGDHEISTISSVQRKKVYEYGITKKQSLKRQSFAKEWHADISFEPVPADYSSLRLTQLPKTGGDTLFASGYEIYDRLSEPYQRFLEGLTATFDQEFFKAAAAHGGFELYDQPRGAPENIGTDLRAVHPVIRTNPVTGWKSIFPVGGHVKYINDVTEAESRHLLDWFVRLVTENHDLQLRLKWKNEGDIAIWDNRSTFHAATFDYEGQGDRFGNRAVSLGERPYYDPNSTSRREALFPEED